jgi:stearoyl-CoA desaturase (delta-9 desaturase)
MNEIIYTLIVTHITIMSVTLFLHRAQAHKAVTFHPILSHFFRLWLWLTTGMITKQWVSIHRKHHRFSDQEGDPHSPLVHGIKNIFFRGVYYYYKAAKDPSIVFGYGKGTPNDWMERKVYTPYSRYGILVMLAINVLLFGWWGFAVWVAQMLWIPFWAAGVINGIGHWWGYRNGTTRDNSKNILPIGAWIGGEELHNNHHLSPGSAKFSRKWFEFDIGWVYLKLFSLLGLATINTVG